MSYDKEISKKLNAFGVDVISGIKTEGGPRMNIPIRGFDNVFFDEKNRVISIGEKTFSRVFLNVSHTKKFMQTLMIAAKSKELVDRGKTASIRELYYQLKHTIPGTSENTFDSQEESDPLIVDLEVMLGALRENIHLKADDKGTLIGDLVIEDSGDTINCNKLGRSGLAIPSIVEQYKFIETGAEYVLVIETSAMLDRLIEEKYHTKNNCIMISTKGQASRGTRRLINRIHTELNLPVIVFTDGDPWGWYIYSVLKAGSMALAHESLRLGTPNAVYVGMTISDVEKYDLMPVTEKLKDVDRKRVGELLLYPWFKSKEWKKEIELMKSTGVRIEQQALASKSLEFVSEHYLPEKIENRDFLP